MLDEWITCSIVDVIQNWNFFLLNLKLWENSWDVQATENSSIHHPTPYYRLMNLKPQTMWFRFNMDVKHPFFHVRFLASCPSNLNVNINPLSLPFTSIYAMNEREVDHNFININFKFNWINFNNKDRIHNAQYKILQRWIIGSFQYYSFDIPPPTLDSLITNDINVKGVKREEKG